MWQLTKNQFDNAGRLANISHIGNGKTYADYDLTWDNGNRITDFDFTYLNGPAKRNESKYRYDKTSQLIAANYNFMQNEMYDFDLNGNRKTAKIQDKNESYKTSEYNRLLSDENYRYEYDQEGNRISKTNKDNTTTKYFCDHRNRLTKAQTPTDTIEYIYDYQNRLVKRTDNQNVTTFIHDDWQIIVTLDSKNNVKDRYLWGTKQDELICNNNNWTLGDHLNTIRNIIKSDSVVSHLEYNAFGKLISEIKDDSFFFGYTGKLFDKTIDLQWNINRWYDSSVGRWMNEDPIGFKGFDHNLCRYVHNAVINATDSEGNVAYGKIIEFCIAVAAGVLGSQISQEITNLCSGCPETSTSPSCHAPLPFCVNYTAGILSTAPENGTLDISYGANCTRPCYSVYPYLYCCSDKSGRYEGIGAYRCNNVGGVLKLQFFMQKGIIKTPCNAATCSSSTWFPCTTGSIIYKDPPL